MVAAARRHRVAFYVADSLNKRVAAYAAGWISRGITL